MMFKNFVSEVAEKAGISTAIVKKVIEAAIDVTSTTVKSGDKVSIPNWGTFKRVLRAERTYKPNKFLKEAVTVPAHYAVTFEASASVKDAFQDVKVVTEKSANNKGKKEAKKTSKKRSKK